MNTSGFSSKEISDAVYRNSLGLILSMHFSLEQIAISSSKSYGFTQLMACSPCPIHYIYTDSIQTIEIYAFDVSKREKNNVSDWFSGYSYINNSITIADPLKIDQPKIDYVYSQLEHDDFQLELVDYALIPSSTVFEIKVLLKSGTVLSGQTQQLNFYD